MGDALPHAGSNVEVREHRWFALIGALHLFVAVLIRALSADGAAPNPPILLPSIDVSDTIPRTGQLSGEQKGCSSMARKRYQKGTLVKQEKKEPKWFGQYREDVVDSTGAVHRVCRKVLLGTKRELPTRKLAQRRLDLVLSRINPPTYRPGRVATFAEFVEVWERDALVLSKPSSRKAAESHLRCYLIPRLGKLRLEEISQQTIQQFVSELAKNLSRHTVLNVLRGSATASASGIGTVRSEARLLGV
jgi:hypothetical protein